MSGLKRAPSADVYSSGDEFTTYKKPLTDSSHTSPLANRYVMYATAVRGLCYSSL